MSMFNYNFRWFIAMVVGMQLSPLASSSVGGSGSGGRVTFKSIHPLQLQYRTSPPIPSLRNVVQQLRGGDALQHHSSADDERYSRQVFTLGARAHGLVRSSTMYLDGPLGSGLLYEIAKNLALSGVGSIIIVTSSEPSTTNDDVASSTATTIDQAYHETKLDDLGNAYQRAARAELEETTSTSFTSATAVVVDDDTTTFASSEDVPTTSASLDDAANATSLDETTATLNETTATLNETTATSSNDTTNSASNDTTTTAATTTTTVQQDESLALLIEYLRRLNPSVKVSSLPRSDLEANGGVGGGVVNQQQRQGP